MYTSTIYGCTLPLPSDQMFALNNMGDYLLAMTRLSDGGAYLLAMTMTLQWV